VDLLVAGHITRDEVAGGVRLGGAASYAALAAACLGFETALVTVAPPDDPLLEPLRRTPRLSLHCVPSGVMTTFALDYAGGQRRLWLHRRARALAIDDIPVGWRRPRIAYVGPVAGECDGAFVRGLEARFVGAGMQGWLRRVRDDGLVEPAPLEEAAEVRALPPLDVAIISELDHPDGEAVVQSCATSGGTAAITRGARGATLIRGGARVECPAAPAREVDPTGAGDVFGVVLTLELARGKSIAVAGRAAAAAAARVVEGPGLGTLAVALRRL
jgi:sugar/nucleoside kinase (ribokinase family)